MRVKLIDGERQCACFRGPHRVSDGQIVEARTAYNQPDHAEKGLLWVSEPDCPEECYGLLLDSSDYVNVS